MPRACCFSGALSGSFFLTHQTPSGLLELIYPCTTYSGGTEGGTEAAVNWTFRRMPIGCCSPQELLNSHGSGSHETRPLGARVSRASHEPVGELPTADRPAGGRGAAGDGPPATPGHPLLLRPPLHQRRQMYTARNHEARIFLHAAQVRRTAPR